MAASLPSRSLETATRIPLPSPMRPVRRQSSQAFEDRRDGVIKCCPGFHHDDLGMVPAFNMLGRGNRLHGKGFGMMQNLVDPSAGWGYAFRAALLFERVAKVVGGFARSS